ncbi:RluA family pseudouridine synthase [Dehalogenimonas sp. 4OHTPN]|uniref:Pseudouridine synthase n=1 Tax=Dehalogenimonas sp. 4OHTPN TaxID=3166643 RepID=A0AAU8GC36_9CHLR
MDRRLELVAEAGGLRLDKFIAGKDSGLSRARVRALIDGGQITVNGGKVKPSHLVKEGDRVEVNIPSPPPSGITPEAIPLRVLYEDNDLAVVEKPAGLTTHPAPGHPGGTLLNAILSRYPELAEAEGDRPGIVHRLDKDTSGLMVVARSRQTKAALSDQFKRREVTKVYQVLVKGRVEPSAGIIDAAIGRHPVARKKMAVTEFGREARSQYLVAKYFRHYTLLEVRIFTGRTHQIRVHLSAIGYPVVGDDTYGVRSEIFPRQFVHAHRLKFKQPSTGAILEFTSELPPDLAAPLSRLI